MGNFDELIDRKNTKSIKWDMRETLFGSEDVIPMWIADTEFRAPKEVNEALMERAQHGIYGYTLPDQALKNAIINWNKDRHGWNVEPEWLTFSNGVVTSLLMAVQAFTKPNDGVVIQTPVYPPFYHVIEAHERRVVKNQLLYEGGYYTIDFQDLEEKFKEAKLFLFCSPHNPVGRVWKKEELEEIGRLAVKHDVLIVSDEIHGDLVFPKEKHIPIASLSEEISDRTITCMAASKTFNVPGLDASYCVTSNQTVRASLDETFSKQGFHNQLNVMGQIALESAYTYGSAWVDELNTLFESHYHYVKERFEEEAPEIKVVTIEGTYLLWLDCSDLGFETAEELSKFFSHEAKVGMNSGIDYGEEAEQFMRMNIGCTREVLEQAVTQIIEAVQRKR